MLVAGHLGSLLGLLVVYLVHYIVVTCFTTSTIICYNNNKAPLPLEPIVTGVGANHQSHPCFLDLKFMRLINYRYRTFFSLLDETELPMLLTMRRTGSVRILLTHTGKSWIDRSSRSSPYYLPVKRLPMLRTVQMGACSLTHCHSTK